jgi:bla regulator protein BlaR1
MTAYFLKSILCLGIFLLLYLLFLEKEKMHRFNRWYLLGSILFSCLVPLVSFTVSQKSSPVLQSDYFAILNQPENVVSPQVFTASSVSTVAQVDYIVPVAWIIYSLVSLVLLMRFVRNIYRILSVASKNKTISYRGANLVLLKESTASYSFLNYIFISEDDYGSREIEEEILMHEFTHVKEKHSWDVIFIELLQTIFWFNPMLFLYKKSIQLNHEYLADEAVIRTYADVPAYQCLLLDKASSVCHTHFTSNFNYSVTKKRLLMLTRTANHIRGLVKKIAVLPLLVMAVFIFSVKNLVIAQATQNTNTKAPEAVKDPGKATKLFTGFLKNTPYTKEGVSQQVYDEYLAFEKKYTTVGYKGRPEMSAIPDRERNKMEEVFKKMSRAQQEQLHLIYMPPLGPQKAEPPTDAQFNKWKNGDLYGVWIDSRKIKNEELSNYKASDFAHYDASKLLGGARAAVKYAVQINLWSKADFAQMNEDRRKEKHFMLGVFYSEKDWEITKGTIKITPPAR